MRHVFFALFEDGTAADAAVDELGSDQAIADRCHVEVHRGALDSESLPIGETRGKISFVHGMLLGGGAGALLGGAVLGPAGFLAVSAAESAVICGALGLVIGALGGVLTGLSTPDSKLEQLVELMRRGAVVVTVEVERGEQEIAEEIVRRHGALVKHHAAI